MPLFSWSEIEKRAGEARHIGEQKKFPVNPGVIAKIFEVAVRNASFEREEIVAVLSTKDTRTTIWVREEAPVLLKRYAIAHQLGHFLFGHLRDGMQHEDTEASFLGPPWTRPAEPPQGVQADEQANMFAASLLMPVKAIESAGGKLSVAEFARQFVVPESIMKLRLEQLGG